MPCTMRVEYATVVIGPAVGVMVFPILEGGSGAILQWCCTYRFCSRSCSGHGWCVDSCRDYIEAGRTCVAYIAVAGIVANGPG